MKRTTLAGVALGLAALLPAPAHTAATTSGAKAAVPWIADDYGRALAEARSRKLPIFIESWAPW